MLWWSEPDSPRAVVILVVYVMLALLVAVIGYVVIPSVVREVHTLSHDAPHYAAQLRHNATFRHYDDRYHITAKLLRDTHRLPELLARAAGPLKDVTVGAASFVTQLITVLAVTFLLVLHGREYSELGLSLTGRRQQRYRQVIIDIKDAVAGYTLGNIVISVLATVATWIVLSILGVPYALALGLVVGFFDLIPLVGATLGAIVVALATVPVSFPTATIVWIAFIIVWQRVRGLRRATARVRASGEREPARDDHQPARGRRAAGHSRRPARHPDGGGDPDHPPRVVVGERPHKRPGAALTKGRRAEAHAGPRDQNSGAARRARMIQRLTSRPITPTTIRMTPTVERLMPASCAVTANFRIAPTMIANKLSPMVMWSSSGHGLLMDTLQACAHVR